MKALIRQPQRVLVAIIVVSTLLRVGAALYMGNTVEILPGAYDQVSYDRLAQRVNDGYGFSFETNWWPATRAGEPTAHWSFLYTLYLAAVYTLFGPNPLVARLIQAVVSGILHPWLSWRIGNRLFGNGVGLLAATLASVYAYFVYYAGALMTETFYILAILWFLDIATAMGVRFQRESKTRSSSFRCEWKYFFFLGVALGVAALLRQLILLFVPFLFIWLWWRRRRKRQELSTPSGSRNLIAGLALTTLTLAVMIAPWTLRNYRVFDQFVLLNTNAGFAFFWGNHPVHESKFVPILPAEGPSYQDLIPAEMRRLDEAALDRALLRQGLLVVVEDPIRYFRLSVSRAQEYFKFWPSSESSLVSNLARVLSFGICLPLMLIGLVAAFWDKTRNGWRPRPSGDPVFLLYLFVVVYTSIHLLCWTLIRYRLPVDAILIIFAAVGALSVLRMFVRMGAGCTTFREC